MSEIDNNRDEIIRFQFRKDFRSLHEFSDQITSVAKLLPRYFNKALPDMFASTSSDLEFSTEHDPTMVRHRLGDGVPHFLQPRLT